MAKYPRLLATPLLAAIDAVDRYYGRHIVWRLALRGWQNKQRTTEEVQSRLSSGERLVVLFLVGAVMFVVLFVWQQDDGKPTVNWLALNFLRAVTGQHDLQLPAPEWRDLSPPLLALFGAPVALFLWYWRDVHTRATIENSRKDTNLKEFQEVQMRAAGALDEKLPAEARETLQVAAIHQLRGFIRGDYGAAFRRPAFELLRARLERSAIERGDDELGKEMEALNQKIWDANEQSQPIDGLIEDLKTLIKESLEKQRSMFNSKPLHRAEHQLLIEDWNRLFNTGLPFRGLNLSLVQFEPGTVFAGCHIPEVNLRGANLRRCHFQGADLRGAQLQGANLVRAQLQGASLVRAQLQGADLTYADLQGANLPWAHLQGADLGWAQLQGADLQRAIIDAATNLSAAVYDDTTMFGSILNKDPALAEAQKAQWRAQGARHVSEPSPFPGDWAEQLLAGWGVDSVMTLD